MRLTETTFETQIKIGKNVKIENVKFGYDVKVGKNTHISNSSIGFDVKIGKNVTIVNCIIGDEVDIPNNTTLINCIVDVSIFEEVYFHLRNIKAEESLVISLHRLKNELDKKFGRN